MVGIDVFARGDESIDCCHTYYYIRDCCYGENLL
jgi:hypothetical protein